MADKQASLIIRLKDEVSSGIDNLIGKYAAMGAAISAVTAFVSESVKAYLEQEVSINRLNNALKLQGVYTEQMSAYLVDFASQLQRTTTYSDDQVLSTMTLLTTFGLAGSQLKQTTQAALDLSTRLGVDLHTATLLLGKAFVGETGALSRYGLIIDENIPKSEKFAAVMELVRQKAGGAAAAELDTTAGQIKHMQLEFEDLQKSVGEKVLPVLIYFLDKINILLEAAPNVDTAFRSLASGLLEFMRTILTYQLDLMSEIPLVGDLFGEASDTINAKIDELQSKLQYSTQQRETFDKRVLDSAVTTSKKSADAAIAADTVILASHKMTKDQMSKLNEEGYKAYLKNKEDELKTWELAEQTKRQNFQSTLQFIASLSTSKNKELAIIGKVAAIAMAKINTAEAITKALASAPPPFNFILAAAVGAAGAAQIATIAGVQLAEGGIVMPRSGGTLATIGEAGSREAVIPLDSDEGKNALGGLGGTTIIINAGTIIADPLSVQEFAKSIDRELFSLRRNNLSVAFDGI